MSEHQAPKCGVYSSLIARRYDLMQEFEKKAERYKELLLQEMVECILNDIRYVCLLACATLYSVVAH